MAVIGTAVQAWSRSGGSVESRDGKRKIVRFSDGWSVATDDADDGYGTVLSAPLLPEERDLFPGTQYIRCVSRRPVQIGPCYWMVQVDYEGEVGPNGLDDSPVNRPPIISWTDTETEEAIDEDINGSPIVNVNGEPLEGMTMTVADLVLNIKRNYHNFSPWLTHQYRHSVSSDTFRNFPAGTARLVKFSADEIGDVDNGGYWEVSASVQFRFPYRTIPRRAWWGRIRNEGFIERAGLKVEIQGGGGFGATAIPVIQGGVVTAVAVTNRGSGYTSTPDVVFTDEGSGSGAAATANTANTNQADGGVVKSIAVDSGGSDYKSFALRAIDDGGEGTSKPFLLTATGQRETNPENAIWLEYQKYQELPYNALGLI